MVQAWRRASTQGIGLFRFAERRAARARAIVDAEAEAQRIDAANAEIYRDLCAEAASDWAKLTEHAPEAVINAIDAAYADNASESTCIDAGTEPEGTRYATVTVLFGSVELIPEKVSALTPTGRPTVKKRTKTDRNALYVSALASTVLATVREALQCSPATDEVRVIVLRRAPGTVVSAMSMEAIYAATFDRELVAKLDLRRVDLSSMLLQIPEAQLRRTGATLEVVALDDPDLADVAHRFAGALSS